MEGKNYTAYNDRPVSKDGYNSAKESNASPHPYQGGKYGANTAYNPPAQKAGGHSTSQDTGKESWGGSNNSNIQKGGNATNEYSGTGTKNSSQSDYAQNYPQQKGGAAPQTAGIANYSFHRKYEVQLVPQLTGVSCWAASAAMLVGYRDSISINPSEIAEGIGYWSQYFRSGLSADDTRMFRHWGLTPAPPQTYTPEGIKDLLVRTNGPLWVATDEGSPHARVITGISGDGSPDRTIVYINDPWDIGMAQFRASNRGSIYTETFRDFERKQRELASMEYGRGELGLYIAHL